MYEGIVIFAFTQIIITISILDQIELISLVLIGSSLISIVFYSLTFLKREYVFNKKFSLMIIQINN